ncbi:MAG: CDP-alcohol phosphatidyltransferase family protein [Opitutaceae bacterium]
MTAPTAWFTLPNAISLARLLSAPVALWVAYQGHAIAYKWFFAAAVASDGVDGLLARLLKAQTVLGARLDAAADTATYLVLFLAVLHLWPEFIAAHSAMLGVALVLYAVNHVWALAHFHKLPAYHTWAGKTSAVLMAAGMLLWFVSGHGWLFTAAVVFSLVSVLEQLAITVLLPVWRSDVPTLVHALHFRREAAAAPGSSSPPSAR